MKFLEFEVMEGFILYIPPFWFYSIRFLGSDQPTIIESYTYNSIMNVVSNLPQWGMYFLQQFNTKEHVLPQKKIEEIHEDASTEKNEIQESKESKDRKSTRLNSSHVSESRMPSSA